MFLLYWLVCICLVFHQAAARHGWEKRPELYQTPGSDGGSGLYHETMMRALKKADGRIRLLKRGTDGHIRMLKRGPDGRLRLMKRGPDGRLRLLKKADEREVVRITRSEKADAPGDDGTVQLRMEVPSRKEQEQPIPYSFSDYDSINVSRRDRIDGRLRLLKKANNEDENFNYASLNRILQRHF